MLVRLCAVVVARERDHIYTDGRGSSNFWIYTVYTVYINRRKVQIKEPSGVDPCGKAPGLMILRISRGRIIYIINLSHFLQTLYHTYPPVQQSDITSLVDLYNIRGGAANTQHPELG